MDLYNKYEKEIGIFVKVCHKLAEKGFVTGYGGNLAWKLEENLILITPTMMYKGDITPEDTVFISLSGETIAGKKRPTGERAMYIKFFNERPDIKSVIHCHAPCVGAFAIMDGENKLMRPLYPETVTEVGPVPVVPYAQPLTEELANKFSPFLQKYNSFIMENHGLVSLSNNTIQWTYMMVDLLEATADSLLKALSTGNKLKELSKEDVTELGKVMSLRDLSLFGAPGVNKSLESLYF